MASVQQKEMQNMPVCHLLLHKHYIVLAPAPSSLSPQNPGRWDRDYIHSEMGIFLTVMVVSLQP